jgi:nitroreductase
MTKANSRAADYPIEAIFLERWSARAFDGKPVPLADLATMFEAARWAPSSYNSQPWHFLYALHGSPDFTKFLAFLIEFNQSWAKNAGALIIGISKKTFLPPGKTEPIVSRSHSLDTGAAWGYFALQAQKLGYSAHGMAGFDIERTAKELNVPDDYNVELAIAVGTPGDKTLLPDYLQAREIPSNRNPQSEFVFAGGFPQSKINAAKTT